MFEIARPENVGAGFSDALAFFANFYSSRVSVSDLIAISTSTATRSCGGPIVPIRAGRKDATAAGPNGTPEPQNSQFTFVQQSQRVDFNTSEMVELIACGHTVGGVYAANFPPIVPPGSAPPNDYKSVDSTIDRFDNRIAVEFVNGNTTDPMSVGPSIAAGRNSDFKVFTADGTNATIKALMDPAFFADRCAAMFQQMVEVELQELSLLMLFRLTMSNQVTCSLRFFQEVRASPLQASSEFGQLFAQRRILPVLILCIRIVVGTLVVVVQLPRQRLVRQLDLTIPLHFTPS